MESLVLLNPNNKKNEVKALQFFGKLQASVFIFCPIMHFTLKLWWNLWRLASLNEFRKNNKNT